MSAVVYLHGFTGAGSSWDAVRALLPRREHELLPRLLGHGADGAADSPRSLDAEVDRLAALSAALPGPRLLAGYSLGARVGLGLLARHPGLFEAAVLVGGQPALSDEAAIRARAAEDERRAEQLEREGLAPFLADWESLPLFATQRELPAGIRAAERARRRSHTARGLALSLRCHGLAQMPWTLSALANPRARIALLAGSRDEKFAAIARTCAAAIPGARAAIVEGAGHNILLERPEAVARALEAT